MKNKRRIFIALYFTGLIIVGAGGFYLIGGSEWTIIDSLYMTIITLSTVGYGEVHQLNQVGKVWSIIVILFGVSGFAVLISQIGNHILELPRYRNKKMRNKMKKLQQHYILCGYGRMGAVVATELDDKNEKFIVIENKPEKVERIQNYGYYCLEDDATMDETLLNAGIQKAKGIVVTLGNDQDNLFVTMSAKNLNPDLYLITRCIKHDTGKKLKRAGANKVINPYITGGHKMAELLLTPEVEDSVSLTTADSRIDMVIDEINLKDVDRYDGIMIKDSKLREEFNLMVVGLIEREGNTHLNPDPHMLLKCDQTILLIGSKENMQQFKDTL